MRRAARRLSEAQVRRVLATGGMVIAEPDVCRVYRGDDARARMLGLACPLIVERMVSQGGLAEAEGKPGRWKASADMAAPFALMGHHEASALPELRPARRAVTSRVFWCELLGQAGLSQEEVVRLKAAAGRFLGDMEQATPQLSAVVQRAGRSRPEAAVLRLKDLERRIGTMCFRRLECLLLEQTSRTRFTAQEDVSEDEAARLGLQSLRALAQAYQLGIRQDA